MMEAILMIGNLAKGPKTSATTGLSQPAHKFESDEISLPTLQIVFLKLRLKFT
jgi:hypothetical protein